MSEFNFDDIDSSKEYKYKILVWPNITTEPAKDSYVVVLRNVIATMRKDIHWTIVSPTDIKDLQFDNTSQLIYQLPTYPNTMRLHFNAIAASKLLDLENKDYDILYSHLPEHTLQLSNLIYNSSNSRPRIVGYCHWYEIDENTKYDKTMLLTNLFGTLEMEECGVNSRWLKYRIIEEASKYMSEKMVEKLSKIIQPHYLGTNIDFTPSTEPQIPKSIVFNHRPNNYTGWALFLKQMSKLWEKRQDFKVYMTWDCMESEPYLEKVQLKQKRDYYNFLKRMTVGIGMFQTYSAWSMSAMDGLSVGVPYILPNKLCYPEMVGSDYSLMYSNMDEFLLKVNNALDNPNFKADHLEELKKISERLKWSNVVPTWFNNWSILDDGWDMIQNSEAYPRIVEFIKSRGKVTRHQLLDELGWGKQIGFSAYRNMLRDDPSIKLTIDGYEYRS